MLKMAAAFATAISINYLDYILSIKSSLFAAFSRHLRRICTIKAFRHLRRCSPIATLRHCFAIFSKSSSAKALAALAAKTLTALASKALSALTAESPAAEH